MSGTQIGELPHSCGTKRGLKVFLQEDGSVNGFCFACSTFVENPYGEKVSEKDLPNIQKRTKEDIENDIKEISSYQVVDVESRKIRKNTLKAFGATVALSEKDGITPEAICWPLTKDGKLVGYHVKGVVKDDKGKKVVYNVGSTKESDLIGWEQAKESGAYQLIITEGPEDMASVHRMFEIYGNPEFPAAVVSLPRGANSARKVIQKHSEDINKRFKKVIFCYDNDVAGEHALKDSLISVPKGLTVKLPAKDANECVMKGLHKAAYNQIAFHSFSPINTSIVFGSQIHNEAREEASYGELEWPFRRLNEITRGIRKGETIYIGGPVKSGKGELRNEIAANLIRNNHKIFLVSPEESNKKSYKLLAGKISSRIFHDPKITFDYEAYDRAGDILDDKLAILDVYQDVSWESVKNNIIQMAEWGAEAVFLDPITNFTDHLNAAEANIELQKIAQESATLAKDLNIVNFLFCHLKAPDGAISADQRAKAYENEKYWDLGNCPHELGGSIYSSQFAGSRAMMRKAHLMIGLECNKDPSLPEDIRNSRRLKILEDREFGENAILNLFWDKRTGRFNEI